MNKVPIVRSISSIALLLLAVVAYPTVFATWGYMYSITLQPTSLWSMGQGIFFLLILIFATNYRQRQSRHFFDIVILGIYLPIATLTIVTKADFFNFVVPFISILIIAFTYSMLNGRGLFNDFLERLNIGFSFRSYMKLLICIYIFTIFFLLFEFGISNLFINIYETYESTYAIRETNKTSGVIGYLVGWQIIVFFPLLSALFFSEKNWLYLVLLVFGGYVSFQLLAVKIVLLNAILVFFYGWIVSMGSRLLLDFLPTVFFGLVFFLGLVFGELGTALLDRFFYLPGLNALFYFDYFSENPPMLFWGTMIDTGLSANYNFGPGYVIDEAYYGGVGTNSSAGYLPSIFADGQWYGVVVVSGLLGLIVSVLRVLGARDAMFGYLVTISVAYALMNHAFMMLFLSNGLIMVLVVVVFGCARKFRA